VKKVIQSPSAGDGDSPAGASLVVVIPDVQGAVTTKPSFEISLEKYRTDPDCPSSQEMTTIARGHIGREGGIAKHRQAIEDKEYAQQLARPKWEAQPDETIPDMTDTVNEILKLEGKQYATSTVRIWVSEVAPPQAHKPGRRPTK
jgi:hypothetical protein